MTHDHPTTPILENLENRVLLSALIPILAKPPTIFSPTEHFTTPRSHVSVAPLPDESDKPGNFSGPNDVRQFAGNTTSGGSPSFADPDGRVGQSGPPVQGNGGGIWNNPFPQSQNMQGYPNGDTSSEDGWDEVPAVSGGGPGGNDIPSTVPGSVSVVVVMVTDPGITPIVRSSMAPSSGMVAPTASASSQPPGNAPIAGPVAAASKLPPASAGGQSSSSLAGQPGIRPASLAVNSDLNTPQNQIASDQLPSLATRDNAHLYYVGGSALGSAFRSSLVIAMASALTWKSAAHHTLIPLTVSQLGAEGASLLLAEKVLLADAASAARIAGSVVHRLYEEDTLIWKEMAGLLGAVMLVGGYAIKKGRDPRRALPQTHQTVRVYRRMTDEKEGTGRLHIIGAPPRSTV